MIPPDVRLYTWVDVEEVLLRLHHNREWPDWLVWARAYWDGLTLGIRPGKQSDALNWLSLQFDPRLDPQTPAIILESTKQAPRHLSIFFEETREEPKYPPFKPSLARPARLWPPREHDHPSPFPSNRPPVVAFHSFKGGVGRTLHALALALAITREWDKSRVLLVDADLEAPGLSWLLRTRLPEPPISFVDFLALAHGDPDSEAAGPIDLTANQLRSSLIDNIYVLPAFRYMNQFVSLEIKPEHLIQSATDPFVLTNLLTRLGETLGVRAVIVDLRAGLSELSAGLLLDPRVHRVLVTTLTGQSVQGTCQVLKLLGRFASSKKDEEPLPAWVISQVPEEYQSKNGLMSSFLTQVTSDLLEASQSLFDDDGSERMRDILQLVTPFDPNLIVIPNEWNEVVKRLRPSRLTQEMGRGLINWLPHASTGLQIDKADLATKRRHLADYAKKLIFAETGSLEDFRDIDPLRRLASDFSATMPIGVIVGAKGAGKTYTFLQIVRGQTWDEFAARAGATEVSVRSPVYSILHPNNLQAGALDMVQETRKKSASTLGLIAPDDIMVNIKDHVRKQLEKDLNESQWRDHWLDIIAWSIGFESEAMATGAGRRFPDYLHDKNQSVLAVVDGLEDLFQLFIDNQRQQTALRALLQDVPEWLEQQPFRPIGLLVFVRQDMVLRSISQNSAQFMARYEPYALKWSPEEALALAIWIAMKVNAFILPPKFSLENLKDDEAKNEVVLSQVLTSLWGRKLGRENSREARSIDWIIAALSDLKGQIQPRDVVRFLHTAAQKSIEAVGWDDRLLAPAAVRSAVKVCSGAKIEEVGQENEALKKILLKLPNLPNNSQQIPFTREQVNLSVEEVRILEDNGVVLREGEEYYMPEIFRLGLGFSLKVGARPRVLALARRVQKWTA